MPKTTERPDTIPTTAEVPAAPPEVRVPIIRWIGWMVVLVVLLGGAVWLATSDFGETTVVVAESDGSFEANEFVRQMSLAATDGFADAEFARMMRLAPTSESFYEAELARMLRLAPGPDGFDRAEFARMARYEPPMDPFDFAELERMKRLGP